MLKKILIADSNEEFRLSLSEELRPEYSVLSCGSGTQALELLRTQHPDFFVMDLMLPGIDGLSLLKTATAEDICPPVLVTTSFTRDHITAALQQFNVVYMMLKPCELFAISARIQELVMEFSPQLFFRPAPHSLVTTALFELSVAPDRIGFDNCRESILILKDNPRALLTKEVYPVLAKKHETSDIAVEKNIRDAISDAWSRRNEAVWRRYFSPAPNGQLAKPSNKVFLSTLAEALFSAQNIAK